MTAPATRHGRPGRRPGGPPWDDAGMAESAGDPGERHRAQATSFGAAAAAYERGRPPYPAAALDWLLPPGAATGARPRGRHREAHPPAAWPRPRRGRGRAARRDARGTGPGRARRPGAGRRRRGDPAPGRQCRRGPGRPGLALGGSGPGGARGGPGAGPRWPAGAAVEHPGRAGALGGRADPGARPGRAGRGPPARRHRPAVRAHGSGTTSAGSTGSAWTSSPTWPPRGAT